ncbi:cytochrome c [Hymenobacter taeanensis]|uniref:Cytochrome c n=2 Tax=Hymenobacteraceae TaxID=1853232 RepID=A0A6M6BQL5_9BACT|nr:cytochrome c [Hymenobacter taeanensis]
MGTTAQSGAQPDSLAQAQVAGLNSAGQAIAMGPALSETEVAGEALFKGNCAQCHAINEVVVGPALMGLDKRRSERWLLSWIKNSGRMVASGDEYAIKIFNQYGQQQMPSFQLSESEIRQILAYVKSHKASGAEYNGAVAVVK